MMSILKWILPLLLLCGLSEVGATESVKEDEPEQQEQEQPAKDNQDKAEEERYRLLPIPVFITEPAIGEGLGVALSLFHPVKRGKVDAAPIASIESVDNITKSREAPPVITAVAGAYTNNDTWLAGVGPQKMQKALPGGQ